MKKLITAISTIAALAFCLLAGAAGYKQLYLVRECEEAPAVETQPVKKPQSVTIYNISADNAVIIEPEPVEIIQQDDDIKLLAACVEAEAGNQDLLGKRLVTDVILNRVDSDIFPDSISGVIKQPHQFSTYWNGAMDQAEVSDETYQAVYMELEERSYPAILFFDCGGYLPYGTPWKQIGDHYFSTL